MGQGTGEEAARVCREQGVESPCLGDPDKQAYAAFGLPRDAWWNVTARPCLEEPSLAFQLLRQFSGRMGVGLDPGYRRWGSRLSEFLGILEGISQPTATVICTECVLELR